jgi:hypothetical protein
LPVTNACELSGVTGRRTLRTFTVELAACACAFLAVLNDDNSGWIDDFTAITIIDDALAFVDSDACSILSSDSASWTVASFNCQAAVGSNERSVIGTDCSARRCHWRTARVVLLSVVAHYRTEVL